MDQVSKCRYCAAQFEVSRDWQLFCSDKCRVRYSRENAHCFYCGSRSAEARDHISPVSSRTGGRAFAGQETVKCCIECNSWLGGRWFECPADRVQFIADKLHQKYQLHKPMPVWLPDEYQELGRRMRAEVDKHFATRRKREDRWAYATAVAHMLREYL